MALGKINKYYFTIFFLSTIGQNCQKLAMTELKRHKAFNTAYSWLSDFACGYGINSCNRLHLLRLLSPQTKQYK